MSSIIGSPVYPSRDLLYASITVDEYIELSTARTITFGVDPSSTVEQVLQKVSKKGSVYLQDEIKNFGLFYSSSTSKQDKAKKLDDDLVLSTLGFKKGEKISFLLKRIKKETVNITVIIEEPNLSVTDSYSIENTIEEVIDKLATIYSDKINNNKEDSCALFLPTKKSKKGVLLNRYKTLKYYNIINNTTLLLKNKNEQEVLVCVEIEDYEELNCPKEINLYFNLNATVKDAIYKLSRRAPLYINDIHNYRLALLDNSNTNNLLNVSSSNIHNLNNSGNNNNNNGNAGNITNNTNKEKRTILKMETKISKYGINSNDRFVLYKTATSLSSSPFNLNKTLTRKGSFAIKAALDYFKTGTHSHNSHHNDKYNSLNNTNNNINNVSGRNRGMTNVFVLGEKNNNKNDINFYTHEDEEIFRKLSRRVIITETQRQDLLNENKMEFDITTSSLNVPYIPAFPRRSLPHPISSSSSTSSISNSNSVNNNLINIYNNNNVNNVSNNNNSNNNNVQIDDNNKNNNKSNDIDNNNSNNKNKDNKNKDDDKYDNKNEEKEKDKNDKNKNNKDMTKKKITGSKSEYPNNNNNNNNNNALPPITRQRSTSNPEIIINKDIINRNSTNSAITGNKNEGNNDIENKKNKETRSDENITITIPLIEENNNNNNNSNKDSDDNNNNNNNTNKENARSPQPGRLTKRNKPGALPKKQKKETIKEENWELIHIYNSNHQFWTIAVNSECTCNDVTWSILLKLSQHQLTPLDLYLVPTTSGYFDDNNKNTYNSSYLIQHSNSIKLDTNSKLIFTKKQWNSPDQFKFVMHQNQNSILKNNSNNNYNSSNNDDLFNNDMSGKNNRKSITELPDKKPEGGIGVNLGNSGRGLVFSKQTQSRWLEPTDVIKLNKLSKGAFAKVYCGTYNGQQVAIKSLIGDTFTDTQIVNFKSEFEILCTAKSPYLVQFIGAFIQNNKPSFVMEYCINGSLYDNLNTNLIQFTWSKVLNWIRQTVEGISALHNANLVHRDIKSLNLLLDNNWNIKVCDFGLSRFRTGTNLMSLGELRGTMAYCAPEIYDGHIFSSKSDIYSLAIVFWELNNKVVNGFYSKPFSEFSDIKFDYQIIINTAKNDLRPTIPEGTPPLLKSLIQNCWEKDPQKRPACSDILQQIDLIQKTFEENEREFLGVVTESVISSNSQDSLNANV